MKYPVNQTNQGTLSYAAQVTAPTGRAEICINYLGSLLQWHRWPDEYDRLVGI
jgi:hypothetical protein